MNDCPTVSLGVAQVPATDTSLEVWREDEVALVTCAVMAGMSSAAALVAAPYGSDRAAMVRAAAAAQIFFFIGMSPSWS